MSVNSKMTAIADALRLKTDGSTQTLSLDKMKEAALKLTYGNIPQYCYTEALDIIKKIESVKASCTNSLVFGVVTDIHVVGDTSSSYHNQSKAAMRHGAFALESIGRMVGCDFIANLGDNCSGNRYDGNTNDYNASVYVMDSLYASIAGQVNFTLIGNHDQTNNSTVAQHELLCANNDYDVFGTTKARSYGYKDFTSKKVRVIGLNTSDYWNIGGGYALSYEQKDFLMRALDLSGKSNASDWQIVILSHIPLDFPSTDSSNYNAGADVKAILDAYVKGTTATITVNSTYANANNETPSGYATYSGGKLVYNYSGKNAAKIVGDFHGHVHNHCYAKMAGNNIWRVSANDTSFYQPAATKYDGYSVDVAQTKTANTANDTAVTWYVVDLDNRIIHSYVYGAGVDRLISYAEAVIYNVTYNLTDVTSSNTAASVVEGEAYSATLSVPKDYAISSVTVTMGGTNITSTAYSNGKITIAEVTGDIVITATAVDAYVPHWDIADRTAVTDMYKTSSAAKSFSRNNYYYGASRAGNMDYRWVTDCSVSGNDITFTGTTKSTGVGLPYHLESGASYTFSASASATGRVGMTVFDANGVLVSGTEKYSSSGTSLSVTFTAPTDETYWVMLIVECYTANASITYTNISLTKK